MAQCKTVALMWADFVLESELLLLYISNVSDLFILFQKLEGALRVKCFLSVQASSIPMPYKQLSQGKQGRKGKMFPFLLPSVPFMILSATWIVIYRDAKNTIIFHHGVVKASAGA